MPIVGGERGYAGHGPVSYSMFETSYRIVEPHFDHVQYDSMIDLCVKCFGSKASIAARVKLHKRGKITRFLPFFIHNLKQKWIPLDYFY